MRLNGASLQEIANHFGVSRQYVHQTIPHLKREEIGYYSKIIYPAIRKWMTENDCTYRQFAAKANVTQSSIQTALKGKNEPGKRIIDAILRVTNLSYEEAFKEEPQKEERDALAE